MRMETVRTFEEGATNCGPLERELRLAGVPIIPKRLVKAHQRASRISGVPRLLYFLLWLPRLYVVPRAIEWLTGRQYSNAYGTFVLATLALGMIGTAITQAFLPFGLLLVPFAGCVATFILWLYCERATPHLHLWSWRHARLDDAMDDDLICPPPRFFQRIEAAERLGARVLVEYDYKDPFLVAVRGFERVRIGAWNTGDLHLDSI